MGSGGASALPARPGSVEERRRAVQKEGGGCSDAAGAWWWDACVTRLGPTSSTPTPVGSARSPHLRHPSSCQTAPCT